MPVPSPSVRPLTMGHPQAGSAIFTVFAIVLMLAVSALAVDAGRLFIEKRNLQKAVDVAALSAVNASGFCGPTEDSMRDRVRAAAMSGLESNGFDPREDGSDWEMLIGNASVRDGRREFDATGDITDPGTDSVMIKASRTVRSSLLVGGWLGDNRQRIQAVAAARNLTAATYAVGSELARFRSRDSPLLDAVLSGLLDSDVDVGAAGFDGLVDSEVTLLDLQEAAPLVGGDVQAGSMEALLAADLSLHQFLTLLAKAVEGQGFLDAGLTLEALAGEADDDGERVQLGNLLDVDSEPRPLRDVRINVAALLMSGLMQGHREHAVEMSLDGDLEEWLGIEATGLAVDDEEGGVAVDLTVIEPPQVALGPPGRDADGNRRTVARTGQADLRLRVPLKVDIPGLPSPLKLDLAAEMELARGEAYLSRLSCPTWEDPVAYAHIEVAPGVAAVDLSVDVGLPEDTIRLLDSELDIENAPSEQEFAIPAEGDGWQVGGEDGSIDTSVGEAIAAELNVLSDPGHVEDELGSELLALGLPLVDPVPEVTGVVVDQAAPVLIDLDDSLIDPLLGALGLQVARARVAESSLGIGAGRAELVY